MNFFHPLQSICDIRFGYYGQPDPEGSIAYLQIKQFDELGRLSIPSEEHLPMERKAEENILKNGDILFTGKGSRIFAWCYEADGKLSVASSTFFVLRPDTSKIDPGYLTAILNTAKSKAIFKQMGLATHIPSIRKADLVEFQVPVPTLETQRQIAKIAALHEEEIRLMEKLLIQKKNRYNAIIAKMTNA